MRQRVAVLVSGRGSNMAALLAAAQARSFPAEIVLVVSNRPGAVALARAEAAGVATLTVDHRTFPDRASFDAALGEALARHAIDLVCLAGFMRIFTAFFVEGWAGRMLNIHPSLLPAFKGTDATRQALAAGVRLHGCTVHFVTADLDGGPIVAQAAVPVLPGDTEASLSARVLEQEHRLYPLALRLVASGKARFADGIVVFAPEVVHADAALVNPLG